jgi:PAS domain S-box-containing protein
MSAHSPSSPILFCIEPDPIIQHQLTHLIAQTLNPHYQLKTAPNAEAALIQLHQFLLDDQEIALVVSENDLPDMSGEVLLRHIHSITPKTSLIILGTFFEQNDLIKLINHLNPFKIFTKPIHPLEFSKAIRESITLHQENGKQQLFYASLEKLIAEGTYELKTANRKLRLSQRKLSSHIQHTPLAYIEWDRELRVLEWNQAAEKIFGYSRAEALHKSIFELIIIEENLRPYIENIWHSLLSEKQSLSNTYQNLTKQRQRIHCEWYNTPLCNEHNQIVGVASLVQDITPRHSMLEALRNSETRFRTVIDQNPVGISITDRQGIIEFANPAYLHIYQLQLNDILGQHFTIFLASEEQIYLSALYQSFLKGQIQINNQEIRLVNRQQKIIVVIIDMVLIQAPDGTPRVITFTVNISKRKQVEEKLQQARQQAELAQKEAEQANQAKSRFLANTSHELRTPLNAILGYAQLMQRDKQLNTTQHEAIDAIYRNADYLLSLINDMLDLSKIEVGKIELNPTYFNLKQMLNELIELFHSRATQKGIRFLFELPQWLPEIVYSDEKRLRQILINLLNNALKFTQQGWVRLRICCQQSHAPNQCELIRFQIEDTGVGIAAEDLDRIFLPFQQANNQIISSEGTGLGLAIVYKLVKMMNGTLQVSSLLQRGSTFWVTLKLPKADHFLLQQESKYEPIIGYVRQAEQPPYRILIVDDRIENRQILRKMLCELGFELKEAINGQHAIDIAYLWKPDLILMDTIMPVMDGLAAVKILRTFAILEKTKIIMISASAFEQDQKNSIAAGCDDFLAKPVQIDALLNRIKTALQLEWIYEPILTQPSIKPLAPLQHQLNKQQLTILQDKVLRGDITAIIEFADQLMQTHPEQEDIALYLMDAAKHFDMIKIRQLLTPITDNHDEN